MAVVVSASISYILSAQTAIPATRPRNRSSLCPTIWLGPLERDAFAGRSTACWAERQTTAIPSVGSVDAMNRSVAEAPFDLGHHDHQRTRTSQGRSQMTALKASHSPQQSSRTGIPSLISTHSPAPALLPRLNRRHRTETPAPLIPCTQKTLDREGPMRGRALRCALFHSRIVMLADYCSPFARNLGTNRTNAHHGSECDLIAS